MNDWLEKNQKRVKHSGEGRTGRGSFGTSEIAGLLAPQDKQAEEMSSFILANERRPGDGLLQLGVRNGHGAEPRLPECSTSRAARRCCSRATATTREILEG